MITVKLCRSASACSRNTVATTSALRSAAIPASRINTTPPAARRCRYTSSPKSLSAVRSTAPGPLRPIEHGVVGRAGGLLRHVRHLVRVGAQAFDDLPIDALVREDDQRVPP